MPTPPPRLGLPVLVAVWLAGVVLTGLVVWNAAPHVNDFTQDYLAALAVRSGRPLYVPFTDAEVRAGTRTSHWPLDLTKFIHHTRPNYHPPGNAVLFLPLSLLPYDVAFFLWSLLSVGVAIACVWLIVRELRVAFPPPWPGLLPAVPLFWIPFLDHYREGQWGVVVMAGLVGGWCLLRQGKPFWAGMAVAVAALVKIFPAVFVLYFVFRRQWQAVAGFFVATGIGAAAVTTIVGPSEVWTYFTQAAPECEARYGPSIYNLSLNGIYRRVVGDALELSGRKTGSFAVALAGLALIALLVRRQPATMEGEDRAYAVMTVAMLLCSPIMWQHSLGVLVLPLAILWNLRRDRLGGWLCISLLALYAVPVVQIMEPVYQRYYLQQPPFAETWPLLPFTLGLLLLAGLSAFLPSPKKEVLAEAPRGL